MVKTKSLTKKEREEAAFRILALLVSGIILYVWMYLIIILSIVNWVITIFTGKRNKEIANFCEYWNTEIYKFTRYISSVSNERPFPFTSIEKISSFK